VELSDHLRQPFPTVELGTRRDVLPAKQEAHEIGDRDRLDLAPQAANGEAMDAGQQPTLAPFLLFGAGCEAAA
jgi:hypothetical protein